MTDLSNQVWNGFHVVMSTHRKTRVFIHGDIVRLLLDVLGRELARNRIKLYAWAVMPDHVHLLVGVPGEECSFGSLKRILSFHVLQHLRNHHPPLAAKLRIMSGRQSTHRLWAKGGGFVVLVDSEEQLIQTVEYIENNPVKAGLVSRTVEYPWTSVHETPGRAAVRLGVDMPPWMGAG